MADRKNPAKHPKRAYSARRFAPLLLALLLSACAEGGVTSFLQRPAVQGASAPAAPPDDMVQPAVATVASPAVQDAATGEPRLDDNPEQLVGLGPSSLAERLGSPGFVRRDGPAEVWQYAAEACILDVFLYRDEEAFKVFYVALRGRGDGGQSRRDCFAGMLRTRSALGRG